MENKLRKTIFLFFVLLSFSGCDVIYGVLDKKGAEEKELVGELIPFEKNPTVEEIQKLLKLYGYNPGKIDGVLGLKTRNAIERFQKDYDLEPTRFVDQLTWEKLKYFKDVGLVLNDELNINLIQTILHYNGYQPGKIDGKLGGKTQEAIISFQKAHGLKPDGKIGFKTLLQLSTYLQLESSTTQASPP
ncbi:MAG: peptidoglycan-binding protein [Candidatus Omnitrophica bacterium]|nr:peptidoglycan-binding protein [Candidatus Omnitrophota bacterium]